jgi:hypothetical protein
LASFLGRSYEEVLIAAALLCPEILHRGMNNVDMMGTARQFGVLCRIKHLPIDLEEDSGVLGVKIKGIRDEHAVVLSNGLIYDPSTGNVWDAEMYLQNPPKARIVDLLEQED